jgi:hypothetical protein
MWRTINGTMKTLTLTLKHGLAVAFATKSNSYCAAMWRTIKGAMKNPNPNLPHVHNDIAWLIQHVSAPQWLRLGQSRLIKVFLKLNI